MIAPRAVVRAEASSRQQRLVNQRSSTSGRYGDVRTVDGLLRGALLGALAQALLGRAGLGCTPAACERVLDRTGEPGYGIADILGCGVRELPGLGQHALIAERADLQIGGKGILDDRA